MSFSQINETLATVIPKVSIIIPAYKVAPFIQDTLDSVFSQTVTDFEAIVINDDSPDTPQLEEALEKYSGRIVYLKQPHRGAGAARNAGLRVARGEYVGFLDGDDIWLPTFLREQLKLIRSDGGYDLAYADAINFCDQGDDSVTNMSNNPSFGDVTFLKLVCGDCNIITSTVLARRESVLRVGGFNEGFVNSQDFDLWLRLAKDADARMTYQRTALTRRRIHSSSLAANPLHSFAGELAVLNSMRERSGLTTAESETLENTLRKRKATVKILMGKQELTAGDFKKATELFVAANEYYPTRKLDLVLICLKFAPRLLQKVCQFRSE